MRSANALSPDVNVSWKYSSFGHFRALSHFNALQSDISDLPPRGGRYYGRWDPFRVTPALHIDVPLAPTEVAKSTIDSTGIMEATAGDIRALSMGGFGRSFSCPRNLRTLVREQYLSKCSAAWHRVPEPRQRSFRSPQSRAISSPCPMILARFAR